jgi:hypothetical protein
VGGSKEKQRKDVNIVLPFYRLQKNDINKCRDNRATFRAFIRAGARTLQQHAGLAIDLDSNHC